MIPKRDFIFALVTTSVFATTALFALIYSLPILCIRRFQHRNSIFTLNVCLATILFCLATSLTTASYLVDESFVKVMYEQLSLAILQTVFALSVILSFVLVAFHRCCSIVYHRVRFFRTKHWVMVCLVGQWILAIILCVPLAVSVQGVRLPSVQRRLLIDIHCSLG